MQFTFWGVQVVEGGTGGWVEVDILGGDGGVTSDHRMARHFDHVAVQVGWRVPCQAVSRGDAASLVLVITEMLNVTALHLKKKKGEKGKSQ